MCDSAAIIRLFSNALHEEIAKYRIRVEDIKAAICDMKNVYMPNPTSLTSTVSQVADYNNAAHRCAYLHKYAAVHTALVWEMMELAVQSNPEVFSDVLFQSGGIRLCSLGGGPGPDVIGVLGALHASFGLIKFVVTIIDFMLDWRLSFNCIVNDLSSGEYGTLGNNTSSQFFNWTYLASNLLGHLSDEVKKAIESANIVTMVKFVSAAASADTEHMVKKIFQTMKPGALVLFIDNAGGGFHQLVRRAAKSCSFVSVYGPLNHHEYNNPALQIQRYGYTACFTTRVSVQIWRKQFLWIPPEIVVPNNLDEIDIPDYYDAKENTNPNVTIPVQIVPVCTPGNPDRSRSAQRANRGPQNRRRTPSRRRHQNQNLHEEQPVECCVIL